MVHVDDWLGLTATLSLGWDPDEHPDWVRRTFETWIRVAPDLVPTLADYGEPPRVPFRADDLDAEVRRLGWGWIGKRPDAKLRISADSAGRWNHSGLMLDSRAGLRTLPSLLTLVDALAVLLGPDYGMIHGLTLDEAREAYAAGRPDLSLAHPDGRLDGAGILVGYTRELREHGLPSLYWRNYFGRPYLDLIGPALEAAPWARLVWLSPSLVRADVSAEPPTAADYDLFAETRDAVMDALGRDLFWPGASRVPPGFIDFHAGGPPGESAAS